MIVAAGDASASDDQDRERGWRLRAEVGAGAGVGVRDGIGVGRPIDAGVDGVGPLARSLRVRPLDLRKSAAFGDVYNFGQGTLVASSGALHAVFPRSVYVTGREVPPGTVFYIGSTPGRFSRADARPGEPIPAQRTPAALPGGGQVDRRVALLTDDRVPQDGSARATPWPPAEPTNPIWDSRRARRVAELLERAAGSGPASER